jgi:two-component system, OmpR family, sensor histidine kinase CiaH
MFKKMRNQLLMVNMIVLSVVMITSFTVIYFITYSGIQKENEQKLSLLPSVVVDNDENLAGDPEAPKIEDNREGNTATKNLLPVDYSNSFILIVDDNGNIRQISSHIDMPEAVYQNAAQVWGDSSIGTIVLEGRRWLYKASTASTFKTFFDDDGGQQTIEEKQNQIAFLDITESFKSLTSLLFTFLIVGVLMLLVLFFISLYFANRSIKPIEDMWEKQKQFVTDASHELKTPLFAVKSNLAVIRSNPDATVESQIKWLDHVDSAAGRMDKLIKDLLYLSTTETIKEEFILFDFSVMAENAIATVEAVVYEKGIKLNCALTPQAIVSGDEERLKQVVFILLDNAVKYTNEDGLIKVSVEKTKHHIKFSVSNTGKPIPKDELPKIFDRFYRIDKSRSGETGGYGLGLSIAKAIVARNGGEIKAESADGKTVFAITLKRHD